MDNTNIFLITVAVVIAVVVIAALGIVTMIRAIRATGLRKRFGAEYDHVVGEVGRGRAAHVLHERATRVATFDLRPLDAAERDRYVAAWGDIQAQFVDEPIAATIRAEGLISEIMALRGYPLSDFDQRAADLCVGHAGLVADYRAAHGILLRHHRDETTTEDLRRAMIHYRALYEDLVGAAQPALRRAS